MKTPGTGRAAANKDGIPAATQDRYDKTVLLAEWVRRVRHPVAWLSLDAGDNDPARFWRHTAAALDRVRPRISERMGPLLGADAQLLAGDRGAGAAVGGLCDAATGRPGSQALLEEAERAGLFVVPLDEVRGWWRYHHLFADLLRARLEQQQPARIPTLHRNAAAWYAERGLADDAIRHAVAAGEMTWAARLIEQHFDAAHSLRGEAATVQRWFAPLPADLVWSRPRLLLAQAVPAATGGRLGKLGAANRTEAVARARELSLIRR